ncbi:hypothetical protein Holit_02524 [Hollandina sp. SP2]
MKVNENKYTMETFINSVGQASEGVYPDFYACRGYWGGSIVVQFIAVPLKHTLGHLNAFAPGDLIPQFSGKP